MKAFLQVISSVCSAFDWGCFVAEVLFLLTFCSLEFKHFPYLTTEVYPGEQLEGSRENG